ncbi:MAG: cysteine desulfurase family protein [Patescibacteria group bacterium]|jgi:cysteine desulfurase|nr:cysteine desulfurase family protein [Patescibacteria group bacterium]
MIYFDHAATTPVSLDVLNTMKPFFSEKFGNPSSIYALGREAKDSLNAARHSIQKLLDADKPGEIIFTSGASESNNLAIKGTAFYADKVLNIKPHLLVSAIEHHSMLDSAKYLAKHFGYEVEYIPVDSEGRVDPEIVKKMIKNNTVFVSVMYGNNETGTLEPIAKIGKMIQSIKNQRLKTHSETPLVFHTDAVQAFQYFNCDVNRLNVDMLSLTAHKFYGPKGVGLLYIRQGTKVLPQQQGGTQERGRRAGTENAPYIIGMAKAMERAVEDREKNEKITSELSDYLTERIMKEISDVETIGPKDVMKRLPHISTFIFKKVEGESILINLDLKGIAASSGSACTSGSLEPSHVTKALGYSDMEAHGSVRFSLGKLNTKNDVDELMKFLPKIVEKLREMSPIK